MKTILLCFAVLGFAAGGFAGEIILSGRPTIKRTGDHFEITFAVRRPTDVEIAVLDEQARVVRHLAAGRVGDERAAMPLKAESLHQTVLWDGADDRGERVAGPSKIRVRAGLRARFGRLIGGSPYRGRATTTPYRGSLQGVAVDPAGNVFVKMMSDVGSHGNSGLWPWQIREFDAEGDYVKTLLPYPPSTAKYKACGYHLLETGDDRLTPVNQNSLYPVFSTFGSAIYQRILAGDELVFVNSQARKLTFFKLDGSNTIRQVDMWPQDVKMPAPAWLDFEIAFSPDGRYAYYSNVAGTVYDGKSPGDIHPNWPNGRIYRHDLSRPELTPQPFYDLALPDFDKQPYWMPSAWDKRTAAAGIDVDPKGNLYICDQVNQQVLTVSPEGKKVDAISLPWPDRVQVHPETGDLYVVSREVTRGYVPPNKLLKVVGRGDRAEVAAELAMVVRGNVEFTIDARRDPTVLWVLAPGENASGQSLMRVEDRGDQLVIDKDAFDRDHHAISFAGNLAVDRTANLVYVTDTRGKVWRFDGGSGEGGPANIEASHLAVGPDGKVVRVTGWNSRLGSYSRSLEPLPVTTDGMHEFGFFYGRAGRGCSLGGLTVDGRGRVLALAEGDGMFVRAYRPDGAPVPAAHTHRAPKEDQPVPAIVAGLDIHASCVRVDRFGNIYIGWLGLPEDHEPPQGFETDEAYRRATGSVLRFGPDGGRRLKLRPGQDPPDETVMGFEGVERVYPGLAPFSQWRCDGSCVCTKPRFDVDGFGRLFIPNAITFSVTVMDNVANPLTSFGQYGNIDSQGPGSRESVPPIPLGWPTNVGVAGDHIYITDVLNHRIVRVDLEFESQVELPVP